MLEEACVRFTKGLALFACRCKDDSLMRREYLSLNTQDFKTQFISTLQSKVAGRANRYNGTQFNKNMHARRIHKISHASISGTCTPSSRHL